MRSPMVVVDQPSVEPARQFVEAAEGRVAQRRPGELVEDGALEALDEPVGPRPATRVLRCSMSASAR